MQPVLLILTTYWPYFLLVNLLGIAFAAAVFLPRLRQVTHQSQTYRHELDKQTQLFAHERAHHEQRLSDLQAARQQLAEQFGTLSKNALQDNTRHFLELATHVFQQNQQQVKQEGTQRQEALTQTLEPVKAALAQLESHTRQLSLQQTGAYHGLQEQIRGLVGLQQTVQQETGRLVEAIRKPHVRGRWGEMTLRRVLESAGMLQHTDFIEQVTTQDSDTKIGRPDVVVRLPEGRHLVIDAKAPFDAYLNALHADTEEQRRKEMQNHARQLHQHIKSLGSKAYWGNLPATPEFVVLFIPGESVFSAALEADPALLENGWQQRVVLATPTSLVATIMAVAFSWKQEAMARNAEETVAIGRDLYDRLCTFTGHLQNTGKGLHRAVSSYNEAIASLEGRVLPKARKFEELGVASRTKELSSPTQVEILPRQLADVHDRQEFTDAA